MGPSTPSQTPGGFLEVLLAFLKLGLTSFGGPVAHLGYFRTEFVERRRWLDDTSYSDLVALCQFLPGPASSQVGMALGLRRCGWRGALAAWLGFTMPSAVALIAFGIGMSQWPVLAQSGLIHGLKIAAVAVVAQAVWSMAQSLCPDRLRAGVAVVAAVLVLAVPSFWGQVLAMVLGGLIGVRMRQPLPSPQVEHQRSGVSASTGFAMLGLLGALLLGLPLISTLTHSPGLGIVSDFFRTGAMVLGGGHVVLPMLQNSVLAGGWLSSEAFMAGYGAAQVVPGPLFTFAAYLGAAMHSPFGGWAGGFVLLVAIFLPAFLLVAGALPFWETWRRHEAARAAMAGVNASVVGILAAALYDPVWTSAIHSLADFGLALVAFALLSRAKLPPLPIVLLTALTAWAVAG